MEGDRNVIVGGRTGIVVQGRGSTENEVVGNFIGIGADGVTAEPNSGSGLVIAEAAHNTVQGNTISGNGGDGIQIRSPEASSNRIVGNVIGTDSTGSLPVSNGGDGIWVDQAPATHIGGTATGEGNVISGNQLNGIEITGQAADAPTVEGNIVGLDSSGLTAVANGLNGVLVDEAPHATIGGVQASPIGKCIGACNLIAANGHNGITISAAVTAPVLEADIRGNYVGTDISGSSSGSSVESLGNRRSGIAVLHSSGNHIGGRSPGKEM